MTIVAGANASADDGSLRDQLPVLNTNNPIAQWEHRLVHAQSLSETGDYEGSNTVIDAILAAMEGVTSSAITNLRPKILGSRGYNALYLKAYAAALDFNTQAYNASVVAGDNEGMLAYYDNLMSLRVIDALATDPSRAQLALEVRRRIARAQHSADGGRYQASVEVLLQALADVPNAGVPNVDDVLIQPLLPKLHGLLGFCEFKLGNRERAREHTALALKQSEIVGDADGIRIYAANLSTIDAT